MKLNAALIITQYHFFLLDGVEMLPLEEGFALVWYGVEVTIDAEFDQFLMHLNAEFDCTFYSLTAALLSCATPFL